jgi:hypothetical protein
MRQHKLIVACVLLLSSAVLAQHTTPGGSSPATPNPPSTIPAAVPSGTHSTPPSIPSPAGNHSISPGPSPTHVPTEGSTPKFAPTTVHASPTSQPPVTSASRSGHTAPSKTETPLSHAVVRDSASEDKRPVELPKLPAADVKAISPLPTASADKPVAGKGASAKQDSPCNKEKPCPAGKNGARVANPAATAMHQCPAGESWNGAACLSVSQPCQAGTTWNGMNCVSALDLCATFASRANMMTAEAGSTKSQMQDACGKNPSSYECIQLTQERDGEVLRYRMLLDEAMAVTSPSCRALLPDPLSL